MSKASIIASLLLFISLLVLTPKAQAAVIPSDRLYPPLHIEILMDDQNSYFNTTGNITLKALSLGICRLHFNATHYSLSFRSNVVPYNTSGYTVFYENSSTNDSIRFYSVVVIAKYKDIEATRIALDVEIIFPHSLPLYIDFYTPSLYKISKHTLSYTISYTRITPVLDRVLPAFGVLYLPFWTVGHLSITASDDIFILVNGRPGTHGDPVLLSNGQTAEFIAFVIIVNTRSYEVSVSVVVQETRYTDGKGLWYIPTTDFSKITTESSFITFKRSDYLISPYSNWKTMTSLHVKIPLRPEFITHQEVEITTEIFIDGFMAYDRDISQGMRLNLSARVTSYTITGSAIIGLSGHVGSTLILRGNLRLQYSISNASIPVMISNGYLDGSSIHTLVLTTNSSVEIIGGIASNMPAELRVFTKGDKVYLSIKKDRETTTILCDKLLTGTLILYYKPYGLAEPIIRDDHHRHPVEPLGDVVETSGNIEVRHIHQAFYFKFPVDISPPPSILRPRFWPKATANETQGIISLANREPPFTELEIHVAIPTGEPLFMVLKTAGVGLGMPIRAYNITLSGFKAKEVIDHSYQLNYYGAYVTTGNIVTYLLPGNKTYKAYAIMPSIRHRSLTPKVSQVLGIGIEILELTFYNITERGLMPVKVALPTSAKLENFASIGEIYLRTPTGSQGIMSLREFLKRIAGVLRQGMKILSENRQVFTMFLMLTLLTSLLMIPAEVLIAIIDSRSLSAGWQKLQGFISMAQVLISILMFTLLSTLVKVMSVLHTVIEGMKSIGKSIKEGIKRGIKRLLS